MDAEEVAEEQVDEQPENTPEDLGDPRTSSDRNAIEVQADRDARNTFPIVQNEFVDQWINYFTKTPRGRATFEKWLSRKQRYSGLILKTVREDGLPEDLIYLAMIESGFNPRAHSPVGAAGVWQFMPYTGKNYGLTLDHWYDERRDIVKATHAAAKYLKELHQIFGSWYLAAASYNAGEGRTLRVVRENQTRNFWELIRKKDNFRSETRNYVPKIIAAKLISSDPAKYGFHDIEKEKPMIWEEVMVAGGVSLRDISNSIGFDYEELSLMNPELRRGLTPPNMDEWRVRVPPDKKELLISKKDSLISHKSGHFITHRLKRGETLGHVSNKYGVTTRAIMDLNQIRSARRVRAGTELKIPVDYREAGKRSSRTATPSNNRELKGNSYTVQSGDNLYDIAKNFKTSVAALKEENNISSNRLAVGQKLIVPGVSAATETNSTEESAPATAKIEQVADSDESDGNTTTSDAVTYTVQKGDSLYGIATKHGISIKDIKRLNGMRGNTIYPGQTLKVQAVREGTPTSNYKVRRGDNITQIATAHGMSLTQLKKWNNLKGSTIYPGQKLKVLSRQGRTVSVYKVKRGDNLTEIARKFKTSVDSIVDANNDIKRRNSTIQVGQKLTIPK